MKEYLIEAIKQEDNTVEESFDMYECPTKEKALIEAKIIADGGSSINPRLMGYTHIIVHECELDEYNLPVGCEEIASFVVK